jgi:hypothetical protein
MARRSKDAKTPESRDQDNWRDLRITHQEGPPPRRFASPMMEPMTPIQHGTFDAVTGLSEPEDSLGFTPRRNKR